MAYELINFVGADEVYPRYCVSVEVLFLVTWNRTLLNLLGEIWENQNSERSQTESGWIFSGFSSRKNYPYSNYGDVFLL